MKPTLNSRFLALVGVIAIAAVVRLVPHPPNFSPITAMALFGGAMMTRKRFAFGIPLVAMLMSDMVLGFHDQMLPVYLALVLVTALGIWVKGNRTVVRVGAATLTGSVVFFLVTNLAIWAQTDFYEKSFAGLVTCLTLALPFFHNSLMSDLFFASALFGVWALAEKAAPQLRTA